MARTIPAPNQNHIDNATFAVRTTLERNNVESLELLNELVAVQAQQASEIDWLRSMIHNPNLMAEFLESRQ
jgi:uncharacterized protein (DUF2461 family)